MSSRLERRFAQSKTEQLKDPFVLSGLSPSLIHQLDDPQLIAEVMASVIRAQWLQIHPDRMHANNALNKTDTPATQRQDKELQDALQIITSENFPALLKNFRQKFPVRSVRASESGTIDTFSRQFQTLDALIKDNAYLIPITALRDVTLELFDLPALATEVNQELKTSYVRKHREKFLETMLRGPETALLDDITLCSLGATQFSLRSTKFGREVYRMLAEHHDVIKDPEIQQVLHVVRPNANKQNIFGDLADRRIDEVGAIVMRMVPAWNEVIMAIAAREDLLDFPMMYGNALRQQGVNVYADEISRLQELARSLPLKKLYINEAGQFFDGAGSGCLHGAQPVGGSAIAVPNRFRVDSWNQRDPEGPAAQIGNSQNADVVSLLVEAALEGREAFQLDCSLFRPVAHGDEYVGLPGTEFKVKDLFYPISQGYPPSVSAEYLTSEAARPPLGDVELVLTSQRLSAKGERAFYIEGFLHRIHLGKVS